MLQAPTEQMAKKVCENRIARQKQIQAGKDIDTINQKRMEEIKELERQERANELKLAGLEPTIEEEKRRFWSSISSEVTFLGLRSHQGMH